MASEEPIKINIGEMINLKDLGLDMDLTEYFEKKGISFTVWCFDKDWSPTLITDWNFTPSTQGRFFKEYLQNKAAE